MASRTNIEINGFWLTGYGTKRFGPAFVNGMAGVGENNFNQSRSIDVMNTSASATFTGMQYLGRIDGGWDFVSNNVTLTPLAGFQYVRTHNNGYTVSGAGVSDLIVGATSMNSYMSTLGGRVSTDVATSLGMVTPEFKLQWAHDFARGSTSTPALLEGVSFTTTTPRATADGALVTASATLHKDDDFSVRLEYNGDLRENYMSHTGRMKIKWDY